MKAAKFWFFSPFSPKFFLKFSLLTSSLSKLYFSQIFKFQFIFRFFRRFNLNYLAYYGGINAQQEIRSKEKKGATKMRRQRARLSGTLHCPTPPPIRTNTYPAQHLIPLITEIKIFKPVSEIRYKFGLKQIFNHFFSRKQKSHIFYNIGGNNLDRSGGKLKTDLSI